MDNYKRYLWAGDSAIPLRTAQRYNLNQDIEDIEDTEDEMRIETDDNDAMDVEQEMFANTVVQPTILEEGNEYNLDETYNPNEFYWMNELSEMLRNDDLNSMFGKAKNLREFMENKFFSEKITTSMDKTVGEIFLMILKFSSLNELSFTGLINLLKLINSMFKTPILPESRHIIDKLLNPKEGVEYHAICPKCSLYLGKFGDITCNSICSNCNVEINLNKCSDSTFFTLIDPSQQIADLLSNNEDYFLYCTNERIHRRGFISDVYDGKNYREFVKSLPNEEKCNYVTAVFNTDGAPKFKCSQYSIWPLYLMINELPSNIRTQKLVVCGLMFTKEKPNMTVFLDKFVDIVNNCRIPIKIKNEQHVLKLYVLSCCVDAVARAPAQGLTQYNGKFGCNWCLHPGEYHGIMKYPLTNPPIQLRNHNDTVKLMLQVKPDNPLFGVKCVSPLIRLKKFDIIEGFTPDYMHMALEGVARQFTSYHLDVLNDDDIKALDTKMNMITVPQQAARYCRKLSYRKDWKAREWENFILYYSIVIFPSLLSRKAMKHWLLFAESLYILLKDNIHIDELNKADEMLHQFVAEVQEIYNVKAMTYNVHILLHLCKSVLNWGPVWANSTFSFESGNQHLLKAVKCAKGVTQQVVRFVNICHSSLVMEEQVIHNANDDVVRYCNNILLRQVQNVQLSSSKILYFHQSEADVEILRSLELSMHSTEFFHKIVMNHCLYESHFISKTRSNNSFAILQDEQFIRIIAFILDTETGIETTVCNYVQTKNCFESYKVFQVVESINAESVTVPTKSIKKVCVYMNVDKSYICPMPNLLHY